MNRFRRLGLQRRIMIYVTVGLAAMFSVLALLGLNAIDQATQQVFRERLSTAVTTAGVIDADLERVAVQARQTLVLPSPFGPMPDPSIRVQGLLDLFAREGPSAFFHVSGIWVLNGEGFTLTAAGTPAPPANGSPPLSVLSFASASGEGYRVLRAMGPVPSEYPMAVVAVGLGTADPLIRYAVIHTVSINSRSDYVPGAFGVLAAQSATSADVSGGYHLEVVDPDGIAVLGIGSDEIPGQPSRHFAAIRPLVETGGAAAMLHEPGPNDTFESHVMAVAPLIATPFYVVLEQPIDIALALPIQLRDRLVLSIALGFVGALVVAWVTTRHVVKPTEQLTAAAERIAGGDLTSPIDVTAQDEVGELAESLETMRDRLRAAYEAAEQTNRELESRVADRTARLGQVLRNTISAQEEERRRLARELHDETAQTLAALSIALDRARDALDGQGPALDRIVEAKQNATRLLAETRRLILGLRPTVLDDMGLIPAIRWYCETYLAAGGIQVTIDSGQAPPRLPAHIEVALFRIVQEAVNNIARHSAARHVQIRLMFDASTVRIDVTDDGRGFDVERTLGAAAVPESVGLLGMQERVKLLGGRLHIRSRKGSGTTVEVEAPVAEEVA